jgi:glucokinase
VLSQLSKWLPNRYAQAAAAIISIPLCAILASVAGDLTLALGAQGGVLIAGGIVPPLLKALASGSLLKRFAAKGRFQPYRQAIPARVITTAHAALRGEADELVRLAAETEPDRPRAYLTCAQIRRCKA